MATNGTFVQHRTLGKKAISLLPFSSQLALHSENIGVDSLLNDLAVLQLEDSDFGNLDTISRRRIPQEVTQVRPS